MKKRLILLVLMLILVVTACEDDKESSIDTNLSGSEFTNQSIESPTNTPTSDSYPLSANLVIPSDTTVNEETFTLSPADLIAPADVLEEVAFWFDGLGGPVAYCSTTWSDFRPKCELGDILSIYSYGWQPNELVKISLTLPNGRQRVKTVMNSWNEYVSDYQIFYSYKIALSDPPGLYIVNVEGEKGIEEFSFDISKPTGPRLHEYKPERTLFLHNFEPYEHVRLFAYFRSIEEGGYKYMCYLVSWQEYQVDAYGQILVQVVGNETTDPWPLCGFIAVGNISGQVPPNGVYKIGEFIQKPHYLEADIVEGLIEIWGDSFPSKGMLIANVTSGTRLEVIDSQIGDFGLWWHVRLEDGTEGWVEDEYVTKVFDLPDSAFESPTNTPFAPQQPSQTSIAIPTDTAILEDTEEIFTLTPSDLIAPDDVLEELAGYFGGGGGMGYCYSQFSDYVTKCELGDILSIYSGGWQPDEPVNIKLSFPDGRQESEIQNVITQYGDIEYFHKISLSDPPGLYTVVFEGETGIQEFFFKISRPTGPRLHEYQQDRTLFLHNFEPHEQVRLFAYTTFCESEETEGIGLSHGLIYVSWQEAKGDLERKEASVGDGLCYLVSWQEFQVDANGQLFVQVEGNEITDPWPRCCFIALGQVSGEVLPNGVNTTGLVLYDSSIRKPSYLVAIADTAEGLLTIWDSNVDQKEPVSQVTSGTRLEVIESLIEYQRWWHVRLPDGTEGWVEDRNVTRVFE